MEEALLTLLYGKRERPFCLRGETLTMTLLPAAQLLELRAACAGEGDAFVRALRMGADLVARCLQKDGAPLFENGRAVLEALSAEEINGAVAAYEAWSREADPGFDSAGEEIQALKKD